MKTKIRHFRKILGWNQEQLAKASGVTQAEISRWETDARGINSRKQLAIANALNRSVSEVFFPSEDEEQSRQLPKKAKRFAYYLLKKFIVARRAEKSPLSEDQEFFCKEELEELLKEDIDKNGDITLNEGLAESLLRRALLRDSSAEREDTLSSVHHHPSGPIQQSKAKIHQP